MANLFAMPLATGGDECITLAVAKAHLRIDSTDEDASITAWITAAREWCENYQNRTYITRTRTLKLDRFPGNSEYIELPYPPLAGVTSIAYLDSAGASQTLALTTDYLVDTTTEPGRVYLPHGKTWPDVYDQLQAVTITYPAGYGTLPANVPVRYRQAILLFVGHCYENREAVGEVGHIAGAPIPFGVMELLGPDRMITV
jgi:uncharacterized phiE125 gp8 family phage protein